MYDQNNIIEFFGPNGQMAKSAVCPRFPNKIQPYLRAKAERKIQRERRTPPPPPRAGTRAERAPRTTGPITELSSTIKRHSTPKLALPRIQPLEVRSPDNFQPAITPENFVGGYYRNVLRYCLGDDLPIKRITMMQRQIEECIGMSRRVGQHSQPKIG